MSALLVTDDDRCASEADTSRIGQGAHHVGGKIPRLGAVGFIHHDQYVFTGIEYLEGRTEGRLARTTDTSDNCWFGNQTLVIRLILRGLGVGALRRFIIAIGVPVFLYGAEDQARAFACQ